MNHSFQSLNSVCIKCTTDFLSFDDFVGDAFDEGVRHRRPSFHKVPPIKRKVEKVLWLLISVDSLKTVLIQPKCHRSSESNFYCFFVCRALRNRHRPASLQPSPMVLQRERQEPAEPTHKICVDFKVNVHIVLQNWAWKPSGSPKMSSCWGTGWDFICNLHWCSALQWFATWWQHLILLWMIRVTQ